MNINRAEAKITLARLIELAYSTDQSLTDPAAAGQLLFS
jgi:hypothetical protein